ncbi:MAG: T9SS type A sorting domain-containing protein [Bacteroidales bacterium]
MKKLLLSKIPFIFIIVMVLLPATFIIGQTRSEGIADKKISSTDSLTLKLAENIRLYPVPAKTELTAENISGVTMIEIFDVTGNKHMTEVCDKQDQVTLTVNQLNRGIYFIRFTAPRVTLMKRFVKE